MKKALIIVDVQNDFIPGGALAVNEGDKIVPLINELMKSGKYDVIVATKDWHPKKHKSFASNNNAEVGSMGVLGGEPQVMWPDHCVQNTKGSEFHEDLDLHKIDKVFTKGSNPEIDSYSGFFDNDKKSATGMGEYLKKVQIKEVDVVGLALDYCVKATAIDAKNLGFKTNVIKDFTRSVNLTKGDDEKAVLELKENGVTVK